MSEKFKNGWRSLIEGAYLCISLLPSTLWNVAVTIITLIIMALVGGTFLTLCWNIAIPTMFGFNKVTIVQGAILTLALLCLRANSLGTIQVLYGNIYEATFEDCQKPIMSLITSAIIFIISIFPMIAMAIGIIMYSWNKILPVVLCVQLDKINIGQAIAFACLFNLIFGNLGSIEDDDEEDDSED